ncbi:MAG: hypothetical protein FGM40_08865 [Rhodocyclaceae bacterium]|nr:hypothetical protein [Rhodocyclaceae bacterium]
MNAVDVRALVPLPALTGPELAGTQLTVGEVVRARVVEAGAQGQPVLMLGGATLAMELPFPVTPGQSLDFTVLEVQPEVRLGVARPANPAQPLPADGGGPDLQISPEAFLLSRVAGRLAALDAPPPPPLAMAIAATDAEALLQQPDQLAMALRQGVDRSGLFYEQHLAQWVSGQRSEAMLRQEPQAGLPRAAPGDVAATTAADLAARLAAPGPEDAAAGLVRQQLEVFQQQTLAMRLDLAPALVLDWQVRVGEDGRRRGGQTAPQQWETELGSDLGTLRRVEAWLGLSGERLRVTLRAAPEALQRMADARDDLEAALAAAGLQLVALRFDPLPDHATADAAASDPVISAAATAADAGGPSPAAAGGEV